ncbi:MAG: aldo/keto reductase [Anaerolineae bacterium]|nr:aldo/keto reductase [Anaerolineae bacterium]
MKYRQLGQTDLQVSTIAMGCWAIVGDSTWGEQDEAEALQTIRTALDLGINFFDTAEGYGGGYSEELLGRALGNRRSEAVIASKVSQSNLAPDEVRAACERSLKNLNSDYIDLYQIHWPSREVPFADTMAELEKLRDEGKIRVIGVSNFGIGDMTEMLEIGHFQSNQLPYSLLWRAIEFDIQPRCVAKHISILPYSPLQQGLLTGKFMTADEVPEGRARTRHFSGERPQARHGEAGAESITFDAIQHILEVCEEIEQPMAQVALAWLLHQPGVTSVLAGARNIHQIQENAAAAEVELSEDVLQRMDAVTQPLKQKMGADPDMWSPDSRYR